MATNDAERRSKQNHDRPGNCLHFRTPDDKLSFPIRYGKRNVVKERLFDLQFLREVRWPYLDRLEEWGWLNVIGVDRGMDRDAYANVTRHFYYNAHLSKVNEDHQAIPGTKEKRGFHTFLLRQNFHITHDQVWKALGRPRIKGKAPVYKKKMPGIFDAARRLFRDPDLNHLPRKARGLAINDRILHLVISENLLPRQGSYAEVSAEDVWLMDLIIHNDPPNLSHMVMKRILGAIKLNFNEKTTNRGLPYGRLISLIIDDLKIPNMKDDVMPKHLPQPFTRGSPALKGFRFNEGTGELVELNDETSGEDGENSDTGHEGDHADIESGEESGGDVQCRTIEKRDCALPEAVAPTGADYAGEEGNIEDVPIVDARESNSANGAGVCNEGPTNEGAHPQPTVLTLANAFNSFKNDVTTTLQRFEQTQEDILFYLRALEERFPMPLPPTLPHLDSEDNAAPQAPPAP